MPNMGYCRFGNTLSDMHDCMDHMDDPVDSLEDDDCDDAVSHKEHQFRLKMIQLCVRIAQDYGHLVE